jgi:hypothetical protein
VVGFEGFAVRLWVLIRWFEGFSVGVRGFSVGECIIEFILKGFVILDVDLALVEPVAIQLNVLPVFSGLLIIIILTRRLVEFIGGLVPDVADGLKLGLFSFSGKGIAS